MELTTVLSGAAVAVHLTGFLLYYLQIRRAASQPNPVSWGVWAVLAAMNLVSYGMMTADAVKAVAAVALTFGCCAIFVFSLVYGRRRPFTREDVLAAALGLAAAVVWIVRGATGANLIVQAAALVGFVPTLADIIAGRRRESWRPWALWTTGYVMMIAVVFLRWQGKWTDAIYPFVGFTEHAIALAVVVATQRRRPR